MKSLREIKKSFPACMLSKWQSWELSPSLLSSEARGFSSSLSYAPYQLQFYKKETRSSSRGDGQALLFLHRLLFEKAAAEICWGWRMCRNMLPAEGLGSQGPWSKAGPCPSYRNISSTATHPLFQLVFMILSLSFPIFFQVHLSGLLRLLVPFLPSLCKFFWPPNHLSGWSPVALWLLFPVSFPEPWWPCLLMVSLLSESEFLNHLTLMSSQYLTLRCPARGSSGLVTTQSRVGVSSLTFKQLAFDRRPQGPISFPSCCGQDGREIWPKAYGFSCVIVVVV